MATEANALRGRIDMAPEGLRPALAAPAGANVVVGDGVDAVLESTSLSMQNELDAGETSASGLTWCLGG